MDMNRQTLLIIIFLVIFAAVSGVLYFVFLRKTSLMAARTFAPLPALPVTLEDIVAKEELQVLNDSRFGVLIAPPGLPVGTGAGGRSNPFAPFQ
jgi:hypothetical protein